ncbi:MAG: thioredoxin [Candidatus Hydrogenedentes bacterium]|nr:thioredoxin [Candidatus Hydrogenedentota bacterium]
MSKATELTQSNFDSTIANGVTLVDFWATWCGPCRVVAPVVDQLAEEYAGKVTVGKVNVDDEQDLAVKYNVNSIPTLLVFKDGEVKNTFVGVRPTIKNDLSQALNAALS